MIAQEIRDCPLFAGVEEQRLESLLGCLMAVKKSYAKDDFVFVTDSKAAYVGIVLSGGIYIIQEDFWGNRVILAHIQPGGLFGEAFTCAGLDRLPFSVIAAEKSNIILIDYRKIVTTCTSACAFHAQLTKNMLHILAEKNVMLTRRMKHLSKRTIREKLLSFLSAGATQSGWDTKSNIVKIPFNRQELADYLCVDRSALSRELGHMQREGLIRYDKNRFELLWNLQTTENGSRGENV